MKDVLHDQTRAKLSPATPDDLKGEDLNIAVVVSRSNEDVSKRLLRGALAALEEHGVEDPNVFWVPDPLELPVIALALAEKGGHDAIVCLGCIIRDETYHFEIVANESARGILDVQLETGVPVANAVLTCDTEEQARVRAAPKGAEAARVAVEMANTLKAAHG